MRYGSDTTSQLIIFHSSQCVLGHRLRRLLRQGDGLRQNTQIFIFFCRRSEHAAKNNTTHCVQDRKSGAKRKEKKQKKTTKTQAHFIFPLFFYLLHCLILNCSVLTMTEIIFPQQQLSLDHLDISKNNIQL